MRASTVSNIAQSIQLLKLDGFDTYSNMQLANISGINRKTINRNMDLIVMLDFAIDKKDYEQCLIQV